MDVKIGGRPSIDDPQLDPFPGFASQVNLRLAVYPERIVGDVGNIHRRHARPFPFKVILQRTRLVRAPQRLHVSFSDGVVLIPPHECPHDFVGVLIRPVRKHHHILPVRRIGIGLTRLDDD